MFNLACADYTFPLLTRRQALAFIALLEFESVDIGLFKWSEHYAPSRLLENPSPYTRQVRQEVNEFGLRVSDVFLQVGTNHEESAANSADPKVRQRNRECFCRTVEFCSELSCGHITGLPGVYDSEAGRQEQFSKAAEEASWRVETAVAAGLQYAIEPHIGSICEDSATTLELLAASPGLSLTLDYSHFIASGLSNESVHPLIPFASHVHARGATAGILQASMENNTIDFDFLLKALHQAQYQGSICCEYVWVDWMSCNRTDNVSETIRLRDLIRSHAAFAVV